jgi:hypothetical protein
MIIHRGDENLSLMLEAAKGFTVNDTVPITLKSSTHGARLLWPEPPPRQAALCCIRGEIFLLFL